MPELRKDPIVGRWVIISTERARRPSDFAPEPVRPRAATCAFCAGNEDRTPPEILADVMQRGIYLAGGGALIRGLPEFLTSAFGVPVIVATDPLTAVVRGTAIILERVIHIGSFIFQFSICCIVLLRKLDMRDDGKDYAPRKRKGRARTAGCR